ncbi:hypothetical protein H8B09_19145 [Paenibacillus sp. PR3]|uniref:Condensation domain-containing protein n=1 Tax=Paenibacillus terricola TaxID=2763503 RepID=A0ABR8MY79_9BACL|nr:condensation domain-containing protein [Paenibacillus terricola]MBD3920891.1 hypothetical protein [Paenibacillus terricola]
MAGSAVCEQTLYAIAPLHEKIVYAELHRKNYDIFFTLRYDERLSTSEAADAAQAAMQAAGMLGCRLVRHDGRYMLAKESGPINYRSEGPLQGRKLGLFEGERLARFYIDEQERIIQFLIHHLVFDGDSLAPFLALLESSAADPASRSVDETEASWPSAWNAPERAAKSALEPFPAVRRESAKLAEPVYGGKRLSEQAYQSLGSLARKLRMTKFGVILLAAGLLSERETNAIGVVVSRRDQRHQGDVIGNFTDIVPYLLKLEGQKSYAEHGKTLFRQLFTAVEQSAGLTYDGYMAAVGTAGFDWVISYTRMSGGPSHEGLFTELTLGEYLYKYDNHIQLNEYDDYVSLEYRYDRKLAEAICTRLEEALLSLDQFDLTALVPVMGNGEAASTPAEQWQMEQPTKQHPAASSLDALFERFSDEDHVLDSSMTSFEIAGLITDVYERFGVQLSYHEIYSSHTIGELKASIRDQAASLQAEKAAAQQAVEAAAQEAAAAVIAEGRIDAETAFPSDSDHGELAATAVTVPTSPRITVPTEAQTALSASYILPTFQKAIFIDSFRHLDSSMYDVKYAYRLSREAGRRLNRVKQSVEEALSHNEAFRTTVVFSGGEAVATVVPLERLKIETLVLGSSQQMQQLKGGLSVRSGEQRLWDIKLVSVPGEEAAFLYVNIHHLLIDHMGIELLLSQITACYHNEEPRYAQYRRLEQVYTAAVKNATLGWRSFLDRIGHQAEYVTLGKPDLGRGRYEVREWLLHALGETAEVHDGILLHAITDALGRYYGVARGSIGAVYHGRVVPNANRVVGSFARVLPVLFDRNDNRTLIESLRTARQHQASSIYDLAEGDGRLTFPRIVYQRLTHNTANASLPTNTKPSIFEQVTEFEAYSKFQLFFNLVPGTDDRFYRLNLYIDQDIYGTDEIEDLLFELTESLSHSGRLVGGEFG